MKRIRLHGKKTRTTDEQFTSIGVYRKTRNIIRKGAAKRRVPIYQHVHDIVVQSELNNEKGGSNG